MVYIFYYLVNLKIYIKGFFLFYLKIMEYKLYYWWFFELLFFIDFFMRCVIIDKWVIICYNLDCLFLMYGFDKNINIFWMVLKFGVDDEKSLV